MSFYSQSNFRKQYNQSELGEGWTSGNLWVDYSLTIGGIILFWVVVGFIAFS
jgi:hypothetical protein